MSETPPLPIIRTVDALRAVVRDWKRQGLTVGFVPTMGALHEGHLGLVREAGRLADRVVASVFVNPTQFAAHEDLGTYPRQEARDAELLARGDYLVRIAGCNDCHTPAYGERGPGTKSWRRG